MKTVIIKYNAGNVYSVKCALQRLNIEPDITDDFEQICSADKVIFPGVGEASSAMNYLRQANLDQLIPDLKQPVLGICLGLQIMCQHTEENDTQGLGIFPVNVREFSVDLKVPHMGWNNFNRLSSPLFKGVNESEFVYFVHSFYAEKSQYTIAETGYGLDFSAALHKDNFFRHPVPPRKIRKDR